MISLPRRSSRAPVVCALVVISQVLVVSGATPPAKDCQSLLKWAHTAYGQAPPTLDQLAAFDRPHRTAIFSAIAPEARAALWREQIRRFAIHEELTPDQRAFVDEAIAKMTPQLYAQHRATRAEVARELRTRGERLFTRAQLAAWSDLAGPASGARPASAGTSERLAPLSTAAAQLPWCQCSSIDPWPECNAGCVGAPCRGWIGCGFAGWYDCDGNCL